jgi:molybdate transport system substrate-binding protein
MDLSRNAVVTMPPNSSVPASMTNHDATSPRNATKATMRGWSPGRAAPVLAILASMLSGAVASADLRIAAPNAVKEVVSEAAGRYERASGNRAVFAWTGSEAIAKRVRDGEAFDVVVNTPQNLDALVTDGKIAAGTRVDFARSGIGVAVAAGQGRPDISSEEALRKALLDAKSIGISSGPSGRYLADLIRRLGVYDQVQNRIKQPPSGAQIAELLARGEVELGFQQISELQHAGGVQYLGPLPAALQSFTIWSGAVHSTASDAAAARAFLNALASPDSASAIQKAGMEPVPR